MALLDLAKQGFCYLKNNWKRGLNYHLVNTTALVTVSNPAYCIADLYFTQISHAQSVGAKISGSGMAYAGLGLITMGGLTLSRKAFRVTNKSNEWIQWIHDTLYMATISALLAPVIYSFSGTTNTSDLRDVAWNGFLIGGTSGGLIKYTENAFRDLTGLEDSDRASYPNFLKRQNPVMKKSLACLIAAASIGFMSLAYSLTPDKGSQSDNPRINLPKLERVVETSD